MEIPNNITFFIPSTIEKLDQTSEPTLEDLTGEDYLGTAIADGGQVVNAMDAYSNRPFTSNTIGSTATWRVDAELDEREKAGFVMIDQHNLRNVYPASTKEQIDIRHHTTSTFAAATEAAMESELSGKLGEVTSLDFNGTGDLVTLPNDTALDISWNDFTLVLLFKLDDVISGTDVLFGNVSGDPSWAIKGTSGSKSTLSSIYFDITNGASTSYSFTEANVEILAGEVVEVLFVGTWNGVKLTIDSYLNRVSQNTQNKNVTGVFTSGGQRQIWSNSSVSGQVLRARVYNRALTIATTDNSATLLADEWGIQTDLLADNQATSDQRTEGDSVASWTGFGSTLLSTDVGDDSVAPYAGTYKLSIEGTSSSAQARISFTSTVHKKYRVSAWLLDKDVSLGEMTLMVGSSVGTNNLGESSAVLVNNTWTYKQIEFTAPATTIHVTVRKLRSSAVFVYADDVSAVQIGCVADYDQSGLNVGDSKWYDSSSSNLDGTVTASKYINVPESSDDYYLGVFDSEADAKFWFTQFNADGLTGTATGASIGQIAFGKAYTFPAQLLPDGGYSGDYDYPGIIFNETDTGRFQSEEKFGARPTWNLKFALSSTDQFRDMREMLDFLKGSNYPFWVSFNYGSLDPVVWRVRLDGGLNWSYQYGPVAQPWSPQIRLIKDI